MMILKKHAAAAVIALLTLTLACGMNPLPALGQSGQQGQATVSLDEAGILERAGQLIKDNKIPEALALLKKGMDQFPSSARILNEAFQVYLAEKRYDEAVQLLDERAGNFPEKVQKNIRTAKQQILQPLIEPLLEEGKTEKAFTYLRHLAESGYQRSHYLRRNPLYEPLRRHAGFEEVMRKISENAGLGRPPRDFTVSLTNGDSYILSAQKGKVVIVDFWSTSCPPCLEELPNISSIYQANKVRGLEVVSISLDDNKEKLDAYLAAHPMPWNTVFSGKGWKDDTAQLYKISAIPALWLVDKKGVLRYFDVRGDDLKAAVEELLAE